MLDHTITGLKILAGAATAAATFFFGGFDAVLAILLAFIGVDYLTGVLRAVCFKTLSSEVGFHGILKKAAILLVVAVAHLAGQATGVAEIRSFVIGFYIANEGISILENAAGIGIPLPEKLQAVLLQLRGQEDDQA